MLRRDFLKFAGAGTALGFVSLGSQAWAIQNRQGTKRRLVVVFLRGAADGLNVVVPYTEQQYYAMRPTIAIPQPGRPDGALDLDGRFALHPSLVSLMPLWKEKSLAFVHASGSPDESRSHFDAQAFMESGTPGVRTTPDGWLNRTLAHLTGPRTATEAVNFGDTMPRILKGSMPVASIAAGKGAHSGPIALDRPAVHAAFDDMYSGSDDLSVAYRQGQSARSRFMSELEQDMSEAAAGAPPPKGFTEAVEKFCQLARRDATIEVAFFALSGWDTHVHQGGSQGTLAKNLHQLGEGLSGFRSGLGADYENTAIMVISEFGRTAHENGDGGTDHGHGNVMWLLGGAVQGGKVYGDWPGLEEHELHESRDLAVTTDFRTTTAAVLRSHLRLPPQAIAAVFPGNGGAADKSLPVIRT